MLSQFITYIHQFQLGDIVTHKSFKDLTTLKIGGKIKCLYIPHTLDHLVQAMKYILEKKLPYFVIGKGSNILASDEPFEMIVISLEYLNRIVELKPGVFQVASGVTGAHLATHLSKLGYTKMEFLSTIPGSIGGLIYMNAGAYHEEIANLIQEVTYLEDGKLKTYTKKDCQFGYRKSIFQEKQGIIIEAIFCVDKAASAQLPLEKMITYKKSRKETQPIGQNTAGSTFKNTPTRKAWEVIDTLGLRGYAVHDARISYKHANFLINEKEATFQDMMDLIEFIQQKALHEKHIQLECEWVILR